MPELKMPKMSQDLPKGWRLEKIESLCEFNPKHSKEVPDETEISFIPMPAVDDVTGEILAHKARSLGEVRKGYTHFTENDVIFAKITPCMENGKAAVARKLINGLACGSTEFHVLRSNGGILPEYLHPFLRQRSYREVAARSMTGAVGQRRVPKQFLLGTSIPVPPLNEQRRIVAKIEALTERSRKAREAIADIPALLDQFRQSVLAAAFRGDLTADWREQNPDVEPASVLLERIRTERRDRWEEAELKRMTAKGKVPKNEQWKKKYKKPTLLSSDLQLDVPLSWEMTNIDNLAFVIRGASPRPAGDPKYFGGNIPWITVAEITKDDDIYLDRTSSFLTSEGQEKSRFIPEGTFLLTNSGATLGVPKISKVGGCINDGSVALLYIDECTQLYLYFLLTSLTEKLRNINQGAAQPNLNTDLVRNILVPLPPKEEQKEIVKHLQYHFKVISHLNDLINEKYSELNDLDQSILAKAFRGDLVPQDPNDEPASVLLDRIRAEREKLKPAKKKKKTPRKKTAKSAPNQTELNLNE